MAVPTLTAEQKSEALKKAHAVRSQRTQLRNQLKTGAVSVEAVLNRMDDEVVRGMKVLYLLESLPKVGKRTARRIMADIGIDESRRLQGLGSRQRDALVAKLT
ncbi:integration host factor [Heliomicrobium modesticaldum Ice1]|uniref:Integration host factor n=1 Tax=Heliobacterium modesticaldum (strain ATCC 51547 / Ice1) TaxID=498761 RepID=B0TGS1_HELMI|nr:integration host factor, actinobacterial type [Heliomicrobium modesticaldum]ABZ84682.1 integration host factor [Heliomicrobium modesticaldum Ice1]